MEIREASLKDINVIADIAKVVWPVTYNEILSTEQMAYMLTMMYSQDALTEQLTQKVHIFNLASINDICVGFVAYELNYMPGETKIHKLYVLPEYQGQGVGNKLIAHVSGTVKKKGNIALLLNVNRFNSAYKFYLNNGFTVLKEEDIDIGNGYLMEDYVMRKVL